MLGQLRDGRPELCDDVLERPAVACVPVNRLNTPAHLAISFARTRRTTRLVRVARTAHRAPPLRSMLGQLQDGRPELCADVLERPALACLPINRLSTPAHLHAE